MSDNTQNASVTPISNNIVNETVMKKVKEVKTRIIQTSQLFNILTKARSSLEDKESENSNLKASLDASIAAAQASEQRIQKLVKQNESLSTQLLNTSKSSDLQETVNNLQQQVKSLNNDKLNSDKVLNSNKMYISQLEAECESLKQENTTKKKSDSNAKLTEKHKQDIAKKNQEIKTLQEKVKNMEGFEEEIKELREENNKLFDENMELRINTELAMDVDEDDDNSKKEEADIKSRLKELEEKLEDASSQSERLKNQLDRTKERNGVLIKEKNDSEQELKILKSKLARVNSEKIDLQKTYDEDILDLKSKLMSSDARRRSSSGSSSSGLKRSSLTTAVTKEHKLNDLSPEIVQKMQKWKADITQLKAENKFLKERVENVTTRLIESRGINYLLQSSSSEAEEEDDNSSLHMSMNSMQVDSPIVFDSPTAMITSLVRSRSGSGNINMPISPLDLQRSKSNDNVQTKAGTSTTKEPRSMASLSLDKPVSRDVPPVPPTSRRISGEVIEIKEKSAYRTTSGLIAPPPQVTTPVSSTSRKMIKPKGKSTNSKLTKFANSRNPSRLISTPTKSVPVGSSNAPVSPAKPVPVVSKNSAVSPAKPATKRTLESVTSAPVEEVEEKKQKLDTHYLNEIEKMIKSGKISLDKDIDANQLNKYLEEIKVNLHRIKSPSDPDVKNLTSYGIPGQFTIDVPDKLDKREKMYAWLLAYVSKQKREHYDIIIDSLSQELAKGITNKRMDVGNARYIRLICMVAKSMNGIEAMRCLCYDILLRSACQNNAISCLMNVAYGWKECLIIDDNTSILLRAVQVCCAQIVKQEKTPNNIKAMYKKMAARLNWPDIENSSSMEEFIGQTTTALSDLKFIDVDNYDKALLRQKGFDFVKAFEIVFTFLNDWKFLYNQFIVKDIYPMLTMDVVDVIALELMGVLGSLGVAFDPSKKNKPGVEHILNNMMNLVNLEGLLGEEEQELQIIAAKGALKLAYNDRNTVERVKNLLKNNYSNN